MVAITVGRDLVFTLFVETIFSVAHPADSGDGLKASKKACTRIYRPPLLHRPRLGWCFEQKCVLTRFSLTISRLANIKWISVRRNPGDRSELRQCSYILVVHKSTNTAHLVEAPLNLIDGAAQLFKHENFNMVIRYNKRNVKCPNNDVLQMWRSKHEILQKYDIQKICDVQTMKSSRSMTFKTWNFSELWHSR